uniref:Uncharacterized protein n=1 Tax=Rhizophora mucronata TaxID=61149 RepID=A0A2P2IMP3_RHIMU
MLCHDCQILVRRSPARHTAGPKNAYVAAEKTERRSRGTLCFPAISAAQ